MMLLDGKEMYIDPHTAGAPNGAAAAPNGAAAAQSGAAAAQQAQSGAAAAQNSAAAAQNIGVLPASPFERHPTQATNNKKEQQTTQAGKLV